MSQFFTSIEFLLPNKFMSSGFDKSSQIACLRKSFFICGGIPINFVERFQCFNFFADITHKEF